MVGELITLPLRIGVGATRLWLRVAEEGLGVAAKATAKVIDAAVGRQSATDGLTGTTRPEPPESRERPPLEAATEVLSQEPPPSAPPAPRERREPPANVAPAPAPDETPPAPPVTEPRHVSEEPVVVEQFAEPGAEDGAGAELHIEAPWSGYDQMNAKQVIARLADASTAELAAVQLYERGHRGRQTILTAAERELRSANGGGRRT